MVPVCIYIYIYIFFFFWGGDCCKGCCVQSLGCMSFKASGSFPESKLVWALNPGILIHLLCPTCTFKGP